MNILLIGGTGFLSGQILRRALEVGHKVDYITRGERPINENLFNAKASRHIMADRNTDNLQSIVDVSVYDAIIDSVCYNTDHSRQSVKLATHCRRLIMISTEYVYSPEHRKLLQGEDDAVYSELDDYGGHKRRAELEILKSHANGDIDATILRPPHIYGPGSNPGTIPLHGRKPRLLKDICDGKTLRLLQGGLCLIHPIYFDDFARIILEFIEIEDSFGQAINCSGPHLMTHYDYYHELAKLAGAPLRVEPFFPTPKEILDIGINSYVGGHRYYDLTKLNRFLPNFAYTPFNTGMACWVESLLK